MPRTGRPPLPIGSHGNIKDRPVTGGVEARCRFRAADGSLRRLRRVRPTKTAAVNAIKEAVVEAADEARGGDFNPGTRIRKLGAAWHAETELQVTEGRKSPKTAEQYHSYLEVHIYPALGELQACEVDTPRCQALLTAKRRAGAKDDKLAGIRNVLNQLCAFAVRVGAMRINPVREIERLERVDRKEVRALTALERTDLFTKLEADQKAIEHDLPRVLRGMLATGLRISELLGCDGDDVLLAEEDGKPRLRAEHRTTRIKGKGVVRRRRTGGPKGDPQKLRIPWWSVPMFRELKLASGGPGPLYPNRFGEWRSNDSVTNPLRAALDRAGYGWVTSHTMRKTVAKVLKEGGLTVEEIAEQLGQKDKNITMLHYLEREVVSNDTQVEILEGMM